MGCRSSSQEEEKPQYPQGPSTSSKWDHRWAGRSHRPLRLASGLASTTISASLLLASLPVGAASPPAKGPVVALAAAPTQAGSLYTDLYILGPGDSLLLTFLDPSASSIAGPIEILNDGTATLALLGSVQLSGLTIGQANRWLTSLYRRLLLRPDLYLKLVTPRPMNVTVIGEVQTPGLYQLNARGEFSSVSGASVSAPGFPTLVTAIQKAGGITLNADVRKVLLRRRLAGPDGAQKQIELNLAELLQFGNQSQNPLLFDGDTIFVAKASEPLSDEVMRLGAANLTPQTISVNVIGEVRAPGRIQLQANTPLSQAILTAGGPNNWRASTGNIELVRINRNGTATREVFRLDYNKGVSNAMNPPLRNNDTIIVNRSLYGKSIDLLNQVIVPLTQIANFWNIYNAYQNNRNN